MTKMTQSLLEAREDAPARMCGPEFDAWLMPLILEALEPVQRDLFEWLLIGSSEEPWSTTDLCDAADTTPTRAGAALSDLRRLGLIETIHKTDEHGKTAYHIAVKWVRQANVVVLQQDRERLRELMNTPLPPIYGRKSVRPIDE